MKKALPGSMIVIGAVLWGLIGIFVKGLAEAGLTEMEIVTLRVAVATAILTVAGVLFYQREMKIKPGDIYLFVGTGLLSVVFFNWCYFTAINEMNISVAVALLYTAPAIVAILSSLFLGEAMSMRKAAAAVVTVAGCALIAGVNVGAGAGFTWLDLLTGVGAGLGYALYSIFGKVALQKYHPFTVTFYTFLVATVFLLPVTGLWEKGPNILESGTVMLSLGLGLVPTVLAYFVYSWGLEKVESSRAAVMASIEPIAATLLGVLIFHEKITYIQLLGTFLIIGSVFIVNMPPAKRFKDTAADSRQQSKSAPQ
ncbi:DMT family transporter [Bacillus sp. T33-2]|uniref:DMT family transporter n=1 Tax=Bacillus sp. T33-2 TaxID=2054168 RepID=UPI000C78CE12|nr:EamA family transporter [Bacillus sp. T33-2]PLR99695.1 EamA family transporter [Bacillus sp. T33-2]